MYKRMAMDVKHFGPIMNTCLLGTSLHYTLMVQETPMFTAVVLCSFCIYIAVGE